MKVNRKIIVIYSLLILFSLGSCDLEGSSEEGTPTSYVVKADESTSVNKLGKLINLEKFRPEKVEFHHTFIETINGGGSDEPKDDYLQAVLYFDSRTFKKMLDLCKKTDYALPNYRKKTFDFPWLSKELSTELENSDADYHGHPDLFFESEGGKLWFLDQKVLFYREIR
ncbi:hypothetical protein [Fluviicola chungangensis]|uniref:Lipoprotein n=1 Tax=Fluviicola chungangensis TaxID=2597671 RepID=A0A556N2C9_9FLAO|nr:hypothetical protein [Fluviicola chungangensis]TSJ46344.1 hypothetical protein FO442_04080 [Fluviicola chungangensis]